ncbi:hypothetical protein F5Y11DRAFT_334440 [Daldinia sp. FL1419]|nr:hypothetical protein F5Y11DRAFT_334440 [Daldinia sp. FL1419]
MLLEQGNYNALAKINASATFDAMGGEVADNNDRFLLRSYWEMIQNIATFYKAVPHSSDSPTTRDQATSIGRFYDIISDRFVGGDFNSTEVTLGMIRLPTYAASSMQSDTTSQSPSNIAGESSGTNRVTST